MSRLQGAVGVRVVLHHRRHVVLAKLIVGPVDELVVVRVVLDGLLAEPVVHGQAMREPDIVRTAMLHSMVSHVTMVIGVNVLSVAVGLHSVLMAQTVLVSVQLVVLWVEVVRLIARRSMMRVPVGRLDLTIHYLLLDWLLEVHAKSVAHVAGALLGKLTLQSVVGLVSVVLSSLRLVVVVISAFLVVAFLNGETVALRDMIVIVDVVGVLGLSHDLAGRGLVVWVTDGMPVLVSFSDQTVQAGLMDVFTSAAAKASPSALFLCPHGSRETYPTSRGSPRFSMLCGSGGAGEGERGCGCLRRNSLIRPRERDARS